MGSHASLTLPFTTISPDSYATYNWYRAIWDIFGQEGQMFSYEELTTQRIRVMKHSLKCSEDGYINRKHIRKFLKKRMWWQLVLCFCICVWKTTYQQQSNRLFYFNCMAEENCDTSFVRSSAQMLVCSIFIIWSNKRLLS